MYLQDGMWVLLLNNMRSAHIEELVVVACAESKDALRDFLEGERVERYSDVNEQRHEPSSYDQHGSNATWSKKFRKGGPLEWFNDVDTFDEDKHFFQYRTPEPPDVPHVSELFVRQREL